MQLQLLSFLLKQDGHTVHSTGDPDAALAILQSTVVDLVVMESVLGRQDGYKLCQQIRQLNPDVPLIVVSEQHDEEQIERFLLGVADDFLAKPYPPRQLLARIQALVRRSGMSRAAVRDDNLAIGEIALNLEQMQAIVNGQRVPLTPRELSLLHTLMAHPNKVLSRGQIVQLAWGVNFICTPKAVDVCVQRLRKKTRPYLSKGPYIRALRGFGYKFDMPETLTSVPKPVARETPAQLASVS